MNHSPLDQQYKVILLGDSSVGKTSLMNRWLNGTFDNQSKPTIGAANFTKIVHTPSGEMINIVLWDTAGQEQYRTVAPLYVRGSRVAIIVASTTDHESFSSIPFWINLITSTQTSETKKILAINKIDLVDGTDEKISNYIEEYRSVFDHFFLVSAKTGENVNELFDGAAIQATSVAINEPLQPPQFVEPKTNNSCC